MNHIPAYCAYRMYYCKEIFKNYILKDYKFYNIFVCVLEKDWYMYYHIVIKTTL